MSTDQHWLLVPEDPAAAMSLEHPHTCPRVPLRIQHGTSWVMGSTPACTEARVAREYGLETFFHPAGAPPNGYESPVRAELAPGVYAVGLEADPGDASLYLNRLVVW